ncbi:restriction endonuclease subunit S [Trichocoleus sp. Lan]|uniref:restriction endonuclease subunit S n=1 Tax=Trichocoleus sp. Lan TaxID=2933927 RepID=UPI00329A30AC
MSELSKGWTIAQLGDLANYINGRAFKPSEWKDKGIPIVRIQNLNNSSTSFNYSDVEHEGKYLIKDGDLLISWSASLGVFIWNRGEAWLNQHIFKVEPNEGVVTKTFLYYVAKMAISELYEKTHGTGMVHVTKPVFESHQVPIPPVNEQRRIVAKLEKLLAKVDSCKERLDKIPLILKRFRQSVLAAACSGRLTADGRENNPDVEPASELLKRIHIERRRRWEESELETISANGKIPKDDKWKSRYKEPEPVNVENLPEIPNSWHWTNLQSIAVVKDPNPSHRYPSYEDGTVPLLSTREFRGLNDWQTELSPLVSEEVYQFQNRICEFSPNDIIFARKGKLGLARRPPKLPKYTFSHTIFIIKCFEGICSDSILWYLRQDKAVEWLLREMNSNTGVPTLGKAITEQLPIPLAPIAEQQEIVNRIETLFKLADQIEQRYQKARAYVEQLTQSILAKAFRGELVPQDPNDEPASVLLERIRAERAKREAEAKAAKKSTGKKGGRRGRKAKQQDSEPIQLELPVLE